MYIYNYRSTYNNYGDMTLHTIVKCGNKNYKLIIIINFDT